MIVTCDHCGARYKLDESRISGRGAKITCPRCRHVFVVYRDDGGDIEPPARAIGGGRGGGTAGNAALAQDPTLGDPAQGGLSNPETLAAELSEVSYDVHDLEFRTVGIQSWKVKVKIGLVYDFSDFKTLSKYIADGRVTESDLLSHDGQTWTSIGEIADLEQHFVDVYRSAEDAMRAEAESGDGSEAYEDDEPTNIVGMSDLAEALGTDSPAAVSGEAAPKQLAGASSALSGAVGEAMRTGGDDKNAPPRFVDPFEQRKKSRGARRAAPAAAAASSSRAPSAPRGAPVEKNKSRAGLWVALLLIAGVAGGGWWWMSQQEGAGGSGRTGPTAGVAPAPVPDATPPENNGDAERQKTIEDIGGDLPEAPEKEDFDIGGDEVRCTPGPDGNFHCPDGTIIDRSGAPSKGQKRPAAAAPSTNGGAASGGTGEVVMSARDHAVVGDRALGRSDYATAVTAYRQAMSMESNNPVYADKLGVALMRSGDLNGAGNYLNQAATGGHNRAHDHLGDLSAKQGDNAGAISHYQRYLQSGPSDAVIVQQKIDSLSGN
jgi:predicted Zn finger-like uncharacterized protein